MNFHFREGVMELSIYVLIDYREVCKAKGVIPSWEGLKEYKKKYWRD
jgi:hypothetical protein